MLDLSKNERGLIEFARDAFGEFIVQFLLSGLGEEGEAHRWSFVVTFTDDGGSVLRRSLYVEPDDLMPEIITCLPRRREPLVMLALLWLLTRNRKTPPTSLYYGQAQVLSVLGWEDTAEHRLVIDEVVERYSFLSYRWTLSGEELDASGLSFHRSSERLVSGYGREEAGEPGKEGRAQGVTHHVDFSPTFITDLITKSLFGVDWNKARSVEREAVS
jgi:hypothetical protein